MLQKLSLTSVSTLSCYSNAWLWLKLVAANFSGMTMIALIQTRIESFVNLMAKDWHLLVNCNTFYIYHINFFVGKLINVIKNRCQNEHRTIFFNYWCKNSQMISYLKFSYFWIHFGHFQDTQITKVQILKSLCDTSAESC